MKCEELAFVNQQLAGMLKSGIPLEGALWQLCANMRRGRFRGELEALEADLAKGVSLQDALAARKLPEFYLKMVELGAQSNDLPGVLTLVADYYQRAHLGWTRLKGLMVYPAIVLLAALGLAAFVAVTCSTLLSGGAGLFGDVLEGRSAAGSMVQSLLFAIWLPPAGLLLVSVAAAIVFIVPALRRWLRWWMPGFRENSLTNFASTMNLMLSSGSHLGEALELAGRLEAGTPAGAELLRWKSRLADGNAKIAAMAKDSKIFPPLFVWLLAQGGEDLAAGFRRASEIYSARAMYRVELLLYVALPVSMLVLGTMILGQFLPLFRVLTFVIDTLGDMGG
ncbi:MAG TPA: type II secretion system F family protein [Haliangiales bacterium]|nr:type II secretion system F family protein [Haliangiales bacterium]